jgi:hypothetical protein
MKRSLILVLVALLALTLCASVFAASAQAAPAKTFTAIGKVKSVDPGASTMVVHVRLGSVGVKRFIGKDLPLTVASNAKIQLHSGRWFVKISLADLSAGDAVRVSGAINRPATGDPVYVAKHIVTGHILPWMKLKHFGFRGPVTAVDAAAGTLSAHLNAVTRALRTSLGTDFAFKVAAKARIFAIKDGKRAHITLADVNVGDKITAFGAVNRKDPNAPVFTIWWLLVRVPAVS